MRDPVCYWLKRPPRSVFAGLSKRVDLKLSRREFGSGAVRCGMCKDGSRNALRRRK